MWAQIVTIVFIWLAFAVGCYILSYLIGYMQEKATGQQTLLDTLYSQLFLLMIAAGFVLTINFTLQEVEHRSLASTILVGYGSSVLVYSVSIHFAICGALRFVMIYSAEDLNDVPDQKIELCVWMIDFLTSGLANLLMFLFNSPTSIVENLYPTAAELDPLIPNFNFIIFAIIVTLIIFCQFGGRLYIYLTSNQPESSNELLSSFTLAIALVFRIGSTLLSKFANLPDSFDRVLFQFGIMVFIPSVTLLNHKSTWEYFARRHPRLTKSIKIYPANPEQVHHDQELESSQEPTFISIQIQDRRFVRARHHQNLPFQATRMVDMPRVE